MGSLLNMQGHRAQNQPRTPSSDSHAIDVEDPITIGDGSQNLQSHDHHRQTTTDNVSNNIRKYTSDTRNNGEENSTETTQIYPHTRALLKTLQKYGPFLSILVGKGLYDHRANILKSIILFATFGHANHVLKREITKQHNRSWISLLTITCYIMACYVFIMFDFDMQIFPPFAKPLTVWELLWSVLVTDFVLKLFTIVFKVILTSLPALILPLRERGKHYLMVEATSQLYRCVAPVQPWLYYLYESYQGPEKILGIFLSTLYTVNKAIDLLARVKLFCNAVWKLQQNVSLGVSPSNEQLIASGGICAICHEEYSKPVRVHCKHIFCETCVSIWLDRERFCPLCRARITDDPIYRDGHTTYFVQLY